MSEKVKPGIKIDKETWEKFKERYKHPSHEVEKLMRLALGANEISDFSNINSESLASINIDSPENWQISYDSSSLTISNANLTCSTYSKGTTSDWKNIIIK